jgi:hypothetical protein
MYWNALGTCSMTTLLMRPVVMPALVEVLHTERTDIHMVSLLTQ